MLRNVSASLPSEWCEELAGPQASAGSWSSPAPWPGRTCSGSASRVDACKGPGVQDPALLPAPSASTALTAPATFITYTPHRCHTFPLNLYLPFPVSRGGRSAPVSLVRVCSAALTGPSVQGLDSHGSGFRTKWLLSQKMGDNFHSKNAPFFCFYCLLLPLVLITEILRIPCRYLCSLFSLSLNSSVERGFTEGIS